ncbi:MAG: 2-oxoacid:acceptor oxidoreductase family protein [Desulfotomaculaceae bacterium]|nr:2-oxoacid:acceptor oxidoreductase family protein [Desulfotomaculaceae bacterium]
MARITKLVLAGEGGQGVQSVAEIIAEAANEDGKQALYIPSFGVEQRGGISVAFVQISDKQIGSPKFQTGDIVVALSERAVHRTIQYVGPKTVFVYESSTQIKDEDLPTNAARVLPIPAIEVAKQELHPRVFNILIMGAVVGATGVISLERIKEAVERKLGYKFEKQPELRELNFRALERGMKLVSNA